MKNVMARGTQRESSKKKVSSFRQFSDKFWLKNTNFGQGARSFRKTNGKKCYLPPIVARVANRDTKFM